VNPSHNCDDDMHQVDTYICSFWAGGTIFRRDKGQDVSQDRANAKNRIWKDGFSVRHILQLLICPRSLVVALSNLQPLIIHLNHS
jgi:hypothetical protein